MSLTAKQRAFVEEFSASDQGMPRSMGLILGFLLVCEPAEQSSQDMQKELGLSAGSISTMISMLVDSGLVSKVKQSNNRKIYYTVKPGSWQRTVEMRLNNIKNMRDMAAKGLAASPSSYRMREVYELYDALTVELVQMIKRLNERKQQAT